MKKPLLFILLCFLSFTGFAQSGNLFGIVRKNYYSTVYDPIDSSIIFQQFDSATIRLGNLDLSNGAVSNISTTAYNEPVNLTGAALNPYDNTFNFIGYADIISFDLSSGAILHRATLNNPIAASYFDNFRFNNSDSTMYGLARRTIYDSTTMMNTGEVYLAKINTLTGTITQISSTSVAQGYAMSGSAIDPYQMVYYFSTGSTLMGIDIYNGAIFSNPSIQLPAQTYFDNFTYSCADSTIYGLVRQNFFSYVLDTLFPGDSVAVLDSATLRLGKIDPNTGVVTIVSPTTVDQGGYSLNAGSVVDPSTMTYYYSNGAAIVGVSLASGAMVSNNNFNFADGDYFDLMRNFGNCIAATAVRTNSGSTGISETIGFGSISIFPNPANGFIQIETDEILKSVDIISLDGKHVSGLSGASVKNRIDISSLSSGIYFLKAVSGNGQAAFMRFVKGN